MASFFKDIFSKSIGKFGAFFRVCLLIVLLFCLIANIGHFMSGESISSFDICLSNVITVIITYIAFKLLYPLMDEYATRKYKDIKNQEVLQDKINERDRIISELKSDIDSMVQSNAMPSSCETVSQLVLLKFHKDGYFVKKDDISHYLSDENFRDLIPNTLFGNLMENARNIPGLGDVIPKKLTKGGVWDDANRILFIRKPYYKVSLGIDFKNVKYAIINNTLVFYGVTISKLDNLRVDVEQEDIDYCLILKETDKGIEIVDSEKFNEFSEAYKSIKISEFEEILNRESQNICTQATAEIRKILKSKFDYIDFIDDVSALKGVIQWYSLGKGTNIRHLSEILEYMSSVSESMNNITSVNEKQDIKLLN